DHDLHPDRRGSHGSHREHGFCSTTVSIASLHVVNHTTYPQRFFEISHLPIVLRQHRRQHITLCFLSILSPLDSKAKLPLQLLDFFLVASGDTVPGMPCPVSLTNHIRML